MRHHRSRSDNWRRGGRASHVSWLLQAEALQRARADEEAVAVGENALHTARPFGSVDKKPLSTLLKNRRRSHAWQSGSDRRFCERLPCLTCWHAPDTCPATVLCSFFCYIKMQAAAMMRRQEERLAKTGKTTACCDPLLLRQFGRCACLVQAVTAYSRSNQLTSLRVHRLPASGGARGGAENLQNSLKSRKVQSLRSGAMSWSCLKLTPSCYASELFLKTESSPFLGPCRTRSMGWRW